MSETQLQNIDESSQNTESQAASSVNGHENENDASKMSINKKKSRPGVVYLSRVPTKMNVKIIREYFSQFGEVDRIYLQPEEKKRKNKTLRVFTEGWVEFKKKKIAKKVAKELNNQQIGGKRHNPWYEELWNLKYLKNFRWTHLNERMTYENEVRKQRLRQEVSLAKKETNFYIQNVEKNEKFKRLEKKLNKGVGDGNNQQETNSNEEKREQRPQTKVIDLSSLNNDDDNDNATTNKRPKFERKFKITDNDTFLKQIFANK